MVDWNQDGKVDAVDYAITSSMIDDDNGENQPDVVERLWQCFFSASYYL